ncbi:MAG: galactokinase [Candidatus Latescibacterota bacterium]
MDMGYTMTELAERVIRSYREIYGKAPEVVVAAPGRVNLIGEHTDYTGGFVLPVAINREVVIAAAKTRDRIISGYSVDFDSEASCVAGHYDPNHPMGWFRYVLGVLKELEEAGQAFDGFQFAVGGDIPIGSGLSSSAALETAVLTLMESIFSFRMEDGEAALLCQRAENRFVGVNCGIMDQLISRAGKKGKALFIDCASLQSKPVPAEIPGIAWVVADSGKRRGLVDSEYNQRRKECEDAVGFARETFPDRAIGGLRTLFPADLPLIKKGCPATIFRRLKHIVTENDRVIRMVEALGQGRVDIAGILLTASHASLRDDFEVSCKELDILTDILSSVHGVHGSRMTGGGFGGCAIALADRTALPAIEAAVRDRYHPRGLSHPASIWLVEASDGARRMK